MSINNIENNFGPTSDIFSGYKTDTSFFEEETRDDIVVNKYANSIPTNLDYSLTPNMSVDLNFLKNQMVF